MTAAVPKPVLLKSRKSPTLHSYGDGAWIAFEYFLLAICLCVIALRTTLAESPAAQSTTLPANLGDIIYSQTLSLVLVLVVVGWLVAGFISGSFTYRFTGIEPGLCLFAIAAVIAGLAATDKRLAINNIIAMLAPIFMAVLLVQILDSRAKVNLVLVVVAALGVAAAYHCAEQFFSGNQLTIEQYEQNPGSILEPMGIEPGSLEQFLFEHRLYAKRVSGYFTTRNSAGSFALLASFAAVALLIDKLKNYKERQPHIKRETKPPVKLGAKYLDYLNPHFLTCVVATAAVISGLAITRSKGAIIGSLFGAAVFCAMLLWSDWLKRHRKAILGFCVLITVSVTALIIYYGITHGRLPGGIGMMVRWQYWQAAAKMYMDHPLSGVGPGNFSQYYPHYKPAAALETIADPHNFLLSILTQYGPLGLVGFVAMIFIPLWRPSEYLAPSFTGGFVSKKLAIIFLIVISAALLLIRPIVMPVTLTDSVLVMVYVTVVLYVVPVVTFVIGFLALKTNSYIERGTQYAIRNTKIVCAALFAAIMGILIHNLIDYAIFEPGVSITFWALLACLIIQSDNKQARSQTASNPAFATKALIIAAALAAICAYLNFVFVPVVRSTTKMIHANQAISNGWFESAYKLLDEAADDDRLSSTPLLLNGRLYLQHFRITGSENRNLLLQAEKYLRAASLRNKQSFKSFEQLTETYTLLAEISSQQEKTDYLNKALEAVTLAVERYPGSGELRYKFAEIAEQLGKTDLAIRQYEKTVEIEDSYRAQFRIMFPEHPNIVSRLGEEKYQFATERMKALKKQQKQD